MNLILKPRKQYTNGYIEDVAYTPMGALSDEEFKNISVEEHQILKFHDNYRRAIEGEGSWWEVYSSEKEVDAEVALQKRVEASKRTELIIKQNYQFFESVVGIPRVNRTKACEMAGFAVRFGQKPQIRIFKD